VQSDQRESDSLSIRATIERYFFAVDSKNLEALLHCFTSDAQAEYHCGTAEHRVIIGGEEICADVYAGCGRFASSSHCVANSSVEILDDFADTDTFAVAHVLMGGNMLVRGLRYQDRLRRTPNGWRIHLRKHAPQWQYEIAAQPPKLF
jgi:SnoaL-like domain